MTASDPDLSDHLDVTIDPDAEPVDIEQALAEFLIAYVKRNDQPDVPEPGGAANQDT